MAGVDNSKYGGNARITSCKSKSHFMVVLSYDDSLVFKFHKPFTSSFRSAVFIRSKHTFVVDQNSLHQAFNTADVMWVLSSRAEHFNWLSVRRHIIVPASELDTSACATTSPLPLHRSSLNVSCESHRVEHSGVGTRWLS